jgi:N-glycosylase/DNA lyase
MPARERPVSRFLRAATCVESPAATGRKVFRVRDYDLAATLTSGQAFRWETRAGGWVGVMHGRWVKLWQRGQKIVAETAVPQTDWQWLDDYLQVAVKLDEVLATFPDDAPMRSAVKACPGLRLLRQDPWECLASFILSSTKQIVQIRQIVTTLCERYGTPVTVPAEEPAAFAFPTAERLAGLTEAQLRACKMGFRAPYLRATARSVAEGRCDLRGLGRLDLATARAQLLMLPGVGHKIADCVLLFAGGFLPAFPLDVWVLRALRELYFRGKRPTPARLKRFASTHFGPNAGYAQQYLFHFIRMKHPKNIFT